MMFLPSRHWRKSKTYSNIWLSSGSLSEMFLLRSKSCTSCGSVPPNCRHRVKTIYGNYCITLHTRARDSQCIAISCLGAKTFVRKKLQGLHRFCVVELHAIRNYSKKQLSENELVKVAEEVQEWEGLCKRLWDAALCKITLIVFRTVLKVLMTWRIRGYI